MLPIVFDLASNAVSGIIEGEDFVNPKGFVVKGVNPEAKPDEHAEDQEDRFSLFGTI